MPTRRSDRGYRGRSPSTRPPQGLFQPHVAANKHMEFFMDQYSGAPMREAPTRGNWRREPLRHIRRTINRADPKVLKRSRGLMGPLYEEPWESHQRRYSHRPQLGSEADRRRKEIANQRAHERARLRGGRRIVGEAQRILHRLQKIGKSTPLGIAITGTAILPAFLEDIQYAKEGRDEDFRRIRFWENLTGFDLGSEQFSKRKDI